MRWFLLLPFLAITACPSFADESRLIAKPQAFQTLVNPACSHCRDEAKRRAGELKDDRVLAWTAATPTAGPFPSASSSTPYRVISDSYGVFVYDADAGYVRGFAPSYDFRFHGWRNGVMVMKHKDGTLYSCLTGLAFDGPKKGTRLKPVPTVVSDWGFWLEKYPNAVAYHMFDKYQPVDLPTKEEPDSVTSRDKPDPRLKADEMVLGVWTGKAARAFPLSSLERSSLIAETVDGEPLVVLWEPRTKTASAYRPVASQPRKYQAPQPDSTGVSKPDEGLPLPIGTAAVPARKLTLRLLDHSPLTTHQSPRIQDAETKSLWDVAGRCVEGELQGLDAGMGRQRAGQVVRLGGRASETTVYAVGATHQSQYHWPDPEQEGEGDRRHGRVPAVLPKPFATSRPSTPRAAPSRSSSRARTWRKSGRSSRTPR